MRTLSACSIDYLDKSIVSIMIIKSRFSIRVLSKGPFGRTGHEKGRPGKGRPGIRRTDADQTFAESKKRFGRM